MTKDVISLQLSKAPEFTLSGLFRALPLFALAAAMALLSASSAAAQDPADSTPPPGDMQSAPAPAPDIADHRKVISRDSISQPNQNPRAQQDPQDSQADDQPPQQRANRRSGYAPPPAPSGPVPANLTLPAGKVLFIRLNEPLSSDRNHAGDAFTATLDQPIVVNGWVVA